MEVLAGLFHYATDTAKCVCYETATTEVSAYINFAESEVEKPADEWDALPLDEKSTWIPDEDTVKFVADRDDWKSVVLWSGWPVLCAGVLDVPVYQPTWKPLKPKGFKITKSKLDKLAKLILDKRFTFVDDVGLQSDLTQHVLDIHQFEPITMGSKLTLSQIVHGLAGMAKNARGDSWAEDIIIQSFTVLERSEYLSLFSSPRVIFIILHDNTHWSLLACLVGHGEIWCYDGAPTRGIREAAYTSCTFLCSALQFDFQLKYAQVPHQKDGWSCGHRCVVHAGYILQFVEAGKFRALPESIPDMVVSQTSFEAVCQLRPQVAPGIPRPPVLEDEGSEQLFLPELVKKGIAAKSRGQKRMAEGDGDKSGVPSESCKPTKKKRKSEQSETSKSSKTGSSDGKKCKEMSSKERAAVIKDLEDELQTNHSFNHNRDFQKEHKSRKVSMGKGHWHQFLFALRDKEPLGCSACKACRKLLGMAPDDEAPPEPIQDVAKATEKALVAEQQTGAQSARRRGRPRKGLDKAWPGLQAWLDETRPGLYQIVDAETHKWLCKVCNQVIKCQRDGDTFIRKHESRGLHGTKLALLRSQSGDGSIVEAKVEEVAKPCCGVNITTGETDAPELHKLQESIALWVSGGMPMVKGKDCTLAHASFACTPEGIVFRHAECKAPTVLGMCHLCYSLAHNTHFHSDLRHWAWKLDLIQLCNYMAMNSRDEIAELEETILQRDYFQEEVHKHQLQRFLKMNPVDAMQVIRNGVLSISHQRRSRSLQAIIDLRLSDVRQLVPCNLEADVFTTLLQKFQGAVRAGTCHESDFSMAAMIAAGKLRSEPVAEALFKSTLNRITKIHRGSVQRTGTSQHFDSELSVDLLMICGKSKECHKMLQSPGFIVFYDAMCSCSCLRLLSCDCVCKGIEMY